MELGTFRGATLDSRQVVPGMLFVAIKGEKVDGRAYIPQARAKGAAGVLEGREELARAAQAYRRTLKATVVGVTGSAGKTTTKELTAAFLRAGGFKVHATEGNYNNDLGLPLTILNCPPDADFLVVEMGTNHPGEIKYLVDIAEPDIGLVSSIGTAHIEFFKTQDGIAREKGVLLSDLRVSPRSFAVLARENERYDLLRSLSAAPVVTVSLDDPAAARLAAALRVRLPGRHNVSNALIARACATRLGVPEAACLAALADFSLPGGRWRVVERNGVTYVDDTYNANPTSMVAALETFASLDVAGRRIAVLGDMFELGEQSAALHAQVKARAAELPLDRVVFVGDSFGGVSRDAAKAELAGLARPGDAVLLKASHGMHLDELLK
ncbi:MAG: UDP-N-acetylmuramoyl-tripeptide--D-alanyl-D-alanine ligase [Kiritimatiellae bacterium]|nr:UDP-N-acetylmuramoyl-tripeptide--D-alanyl-D-alanine ligase [Kiritimatiellia bacterium]